LATAIATACTVSAQDLVRGPDTGTNGIALLCIPGAPLMGKSNLEWKRVQADGSTVMTHETSNLARDSQGRIYREKHDFVPMDVDAMSGLLELQIYDTVEHTKTICNVRNHQCDLMDYAPVAKFYARPEGWNKDHTSYVHLESLGTNQVQGQDVNGVRETLAVNAGVMGNEHPLISTREFWYAVPLQTNLLTVRKDALHGDYTLRLIDLNVGEPDPELFKVPGGFVVTDKRAHGTTVVPK